MPTTAQNTFNNLGLEPVVDPEQAVLRPVKLVASITYAQGQVLGEQIGSNSIQTVSITGAPTGGTFTLTFGAQATAAIAFGASNEAIQAAIEALSTVGAGNVKVTGGWNAVGAKIIIEFRGALGHAAQTAVTCSIASLTGGTAAQAVAQTQTGAAGTPGLFGKYSSTATDGLQVPRCVLKYACTTDASNNITGPGGEHGETTLSIPAYFAGTFNTLDVTGLTDGVIAQLGRLMSGGIEATLGGVWRLG